MPSHLLVPDSVRAFIREIGSGELRKAVQVAIFSLADDPVPPDCRERGEWPYLWYEMDVDEVITLSWTTHDDYVLISSVAWRTI